MKDCITDWLFHYNNITKLWNAVKRDNYHQLFNGGENVLKSSKFETLIELISKTNGSNKLIKKLVK